MNERRSIAQSSGKILLKRRLLRRLDTTASVIRPAVLTKLRSGYATFKKGFLILLMFCLSSRSLRSG